MNTSQKKNFLRNRINSEINKSENYPNDLLNINNLLFKFIETQKSKVIGVYCAIKDEIPLTRLIQKLWQKKYIVCAPKVMGSDLNYFRIYSTEDLSIGRFKIYEPNDDCLEVDKKIIELLILPGRSFDKVGTRLGSGYGYFDRFLINFSGKTIGVCASGQFTDNLPREPHDRQVLYVTTEKGIWDTNKRKFILQLDQPQQSKN